MTRDEFIAECRLRGMGVMRSEYDKAVGACIPGHTLPNRTSAYTLAWEGGELTIYYDGGVAWDAMCVNGFRRKDFRLEMRGGDFETMYQSLKFFELTHVS